MVQTEEGFIWENVTIFVKYLVTSLFYGLYQSSPASEMASLSQGNVNLMKMQNLVVVGKSFKLQTIVESDFNIKYE